jgi:two-component system, NtrC family, response regulator PilR
MGEPPVRHELCSRARPAFGMAPSYRLLIAEDDDNLRESLRAVLETQGYAISAVATGEEAISVGRTQFIHCAILDYRMGDMTGLEVFRQLRALHHAPTSILISAELERPLERQAIQAGIAGCLKKPIYPDVLRSMVAGLLKTGPGPLSDPQQPRAPR